MSWNDYRAAMERAADFREFRRRHLRGGARSAPRRRTERWSCGLRLPEPNVRAVSSFPRATTLGKVAVAAAICLAIGGTAYATASFEDLARIAADADQAQVAEVFEQGAGERIDETQRVGDFDITLLGLTSGQALVPLTEGVNANRTYAVLSLARAMGRRSIRPTLTNRQNAGSRTA